tara:strand:- start:6448 stop:6810 length:363 start_codon:yes stop_codon:yes gene_type:complete
MKLELTSKNILVYAAQNYYNPVCIDSDEFFSDLKRFKYVKRLLNKYKASGDISERLVLNHLIVLFNVFGFDAGMEMLALRIEIEHWPALKPFLIFLKAVTNEDLIGIELDAHVVQILRNL